MEFSCKLILDSDKFYQKQPISGNLEMYFRKHVNVDLILIEIQGISHCSWKLDRHLISPPKIYHKRTKYEGNNEFFLSRHTLFGRNGTANIEKGDHTFPFQARLPGNMPGTWKGEHGYVKYMAKITVKLEKRETVTHNQEIHVAFHRDLALEDHLLCDFRRDLRRKFHYAIISLGNVKISIWLPLCGVAAGQSFPILCTIDNKSTVHFGGIVFVLTQIELYRSDSPINTVKKVRNDICRIARMVDVLPGKYNYYTVMQTNKDLASTNQFWKCKSCQLTYEVWVSLQGSLPRFRAYGYPNIDSYGIPIIIGTEPLCDWNSDDIATRIMQEVLNCHPIVMMEPPPPDDEVQELLNNVEEELDEATTQNLTRQLEEVYVRKILQEAHQRNSENPPNKQEILSATNSILIKANLMDFAKIQLEKYGWREGKGLGKNENGIAAPLKPKLKFDTHGIGHNIGSEFTNNWWETLYNNSSRNLNINNNNGTSEITTKREDKTENGQHSILKNQKNFQYRSFIKTSKLTDGGVVNLKSNVEEATTTSKTRVLNDEELFLACGARTAHKGARHGVKQSGKLSRIEKQEKILLKKMQTVSLNDEKVAIEKKIKKLGDGKEKKKTTETSLNVTPKKKHNNSKKSVSFNEVVTEFQNPDLDTSSLSIDSETSGKIKTEEIELENNDALKEVDEGIEQDFDGGNFEHSSPSADDIKGKHDVFKHKRKLERKNLTATFKFLEEMNNTTSNKNTEETEECDKCKKRKMKTEYGENEENGAKRSHYDGDKLTKKQKQKLKRREARKLNRIVKSMNKMCKISDTE